MVNNIKPAKNYYNKFEFEFFAPLLALLLAGQPYFYFKIGLVSLIISLAIGKAVLTAEIIIIGLSQWFFL